MLLAGPSPRPFKSTVLSAISWKASPTVPRGDIVSVYEGLVIPGTFGPSLRSLLLRGELRAFVGDKPRPQADSNCPAVT
jgi:hypothetical protein